MSAKKYAIAPMSAEIALKYGKTVSKGIADMQKRIEARQEKSKKEQPKGGDSR